MSETPLAKEPPTVPVPAASDPTAGPVRRATISSDIQLYGLIAAILLVGVVFQVATNGIFLGPFNLSNLGRQLAVLGVAAAGVTVVITMGEFDLSTGGAMVLIVTVIGALVIVQEQPGWIALPVGLLVGLGIGVMQGFLIYRLTKIGFRTASFIITLAGMMAYPALGLLILPQAAAPLPEWYAQVGTASVPGVIAAPLLIVGAILGVVLLIQPVRQGKRSFGSVLPAIITLVLVMIPMTQMTLSRGFPWLLVICLAWVLVVEIVTQLTVFGRHLYAIGGNRQNARLTGIDIGRTTIIAFTVMGFVYWLTGAMTLARLNAASPVIGGELALQAIAAAAIGGISLVGGRGRPYQALLGAVVITGLANGLNLLNVPSLWQNVLTGVVLVVAVWFDVWVRNRSNSIVYA
jgi:ABC-type xylose transport system permease subunit